MLQIAPPLSTMLGQSKRVQSWWNIGLGAIISVPVVQIMSGVALATPDVSTSLVSVNSGYNASVNKKSSTFSSSIIVADNAAYSGVYPVLSVPTTDVNHVNAQGSLGEALLPSPPVHDQMLCRQNCSNSDVFVLQQYPSSSQRQISQGEGNANRFSNAPSNQTYLRQLMAVYGGSTQASGSWQSPDQFQFPSSQVGTEQDVSFQSPAVQQTDNMGRSSLATPNVNFQGVSIAGDDDFSGRARLTATYPVNQNLLLGTSVEATTGNTFSDSQQEGIGLNELYLAASVPSSPNLRIVAGKIDLSSYFDRNSFAKDGATQFFNSAFQTSPAIISSLGDSSLGALVNWSINDNLELRAATFSSDGDLEDFSLDGYAGEVAYRFGNAIIRGTYASGRDGGENTGFRNSFLIDRGNGQTGILENDREVAYGINGEIFFPDINLGLFGRYGVYENQTLDLSGDSFSIGVTAFDLFTDNDRLGLAYGQTISNDTLRQQPGATEPDVLEVFYDFELVDHLMLGVSVQQFDDLADTMLQFRLGYNTNFDSVRP